ncbi:MAG: ComEC/Rec2 family competence protein [Devosia sp.]|nr:ComEC/Rec2 family competence protein [Devosia sp.]
MVAELVDIDRGGASPRLAPAPVLQRRGTTFRFGLAEALAGALEERRLFILLPFIAIVGLITSLVLPDSPDLVMLASIAGALLLILLFAARSPLLLVRATLVAAAFWGGFTLLAVHGALFGTPMLARPAYGVYDMRIDEVLSRADDGTRVIVSSIRPVAEARALPVRRARLVISTEDHLAPGDVVRSPVRFYEVPGPVVPNGFDTQFHAYFDGIGAYGASTGVVERLASGEQSDPRRIVDAVRGGIASRIDAVLSQPAAGIARALITGDQSEVGELARENMATAGLAHVLSVSGLHLTMVAMLVMAALRSCLAIWSSLDRIVSTKRLAAAGAIVAALAYFSISGGNVAAQRATIMILLILGAVLFGRRALTMRNVAIAALAVITTDPASVFRPSFQLSFAAVVALIGAWEMLGRQQGRDMSIARRVLGYLGGIVATSFVAGAATLLFSIYHFQQTSPLSILGNLFSLPLIGFVTMPAALVATLAMPLGLEAWPLAVMGWSIERMLDVSVVIAAWSSAISLSPLLTPVALCLGLLAIAWFAFLTSWHRLLGPALLPLAIIVMALDGPPDVLVADTTQAVAVRGDEGLGLVMGRGSSFAVDVWRETYSEKLEESPLLTCDSVGCFGRSPAGFTVAIVKDPAGFYEDCPLVDLVISRRVAPGDCDAGVVLDAPALAKGGVHWLRWHAERQRFDVRPAIVATTRPWRVPE